MRGFAALSKADVIVFDALANTNLLDLAPADAERINVGKRGGDHTLSQYEVNNLLVTKADEGKHVVRLKGGDPYVFGRGAEEVTHVAGQGVACEVVPGVTAGIAAPMMAGIPVTHRDHASCVVFVTGHEDPDKGQTSVDYKALAALIRGGGTACFYMSVARLSSIIAGLRANDLSSSTPAAVIEWGCTPRQKTFRGTLSDVSSTGLNSPAIVVVGKVAAIEESGLGFYALRPLFGQRVVITRTRQQSSLLRDKLAAVGADVLEAPTIVIDEPDNWAPIDDAIKRVGDYDWLVLTSVNGVAAFDQRLRHLSMDARCLASVKVATIGDATADAVADLLRIQPDLVPDNYVAEALAEALIKHGVKGKKMLLLRADIARQDLPELLSRAGANITEHHVYRTRLADGLPSNVLDALREKSIDWITFTSSSTARNMVELLGDEQELLNHLKTASIGPITSRTMRECGIDITVEATTSNLDGLIDSMMTAP